MKWLGRGLWMLAWGAWAWFGVGLYRELPRELGAPVAELPQGTRVGFVEDSNAFVIMTSANVRGQWASKVFVTDAKTGSIEREVLGPPFGNYLQPFGSARLRHGLFTTWLPDDVEGPRTSGLFRLDLKTGKWQCVLDHGIKHVGLHLQKPWAVVVEAPEKPGGREQVVVIDWESGRKTVVCRRDEGSPVVGNVYFVADGDRVAVPSPSTMPAGREGLLRCVEIWTTGDAPALEKRVEGTPHSDQLVSCSPGGRIAFQDFRGPPLLSVYDLNLGTRIFPTGREEKLPPGPTLLVEPALSRSGQRVLGGNLIALWDLESDKALWVSSTSEMPSAETGDDVFSVTEHWGWLWRLWLPSVEYTTYALRSLETGKLILRTSSPLKLSRMIMNADRTLVIADSAVYRLPLAVNWGMLGLCQIVLAMPLGLAWVVLWWRRRRRAVRAEAAA